MFIAAITLIFVSTHGPIYLVPASITSFSLLLPVLLMLPGSSVLLFLFLSALCFFASCRIRRFVIPVHLLFSLSLAAMYAISCPGCNVLFDPPMLSRLSLYRVQILCILVYTLLYAYTSIV